LYTAVATKRKLVSVFITLEHHGMLAVSKNTSSSAIAEKPRCKVG